MIVSTETQLTITLWMKVLFRSQKLRACKNKRQRFNFSSSSWKTTDVFFDAVHSESHISSSFRGSELVYRRVCYVSHDPRAMIKWLKTYSKEISISIRVKFGIPAVKLYYALWLYSLAPALLAPDTVVNKRSKYVVLLTKWPHIKCSHFIWYLTNLTRYR